MIRMRYSELDQREEEPGRDPEYTAWTKNMFMGNFDDPDATSWTNISSIKS